MAILAGDHQHQ